MCGTVRCHTVMGSCPPVVWRFIGLWAGCLCSVIGQDVASAPAVLSFIGAQIWRCERRRKKATCTPQVLRVKPIISGCIPLISHLKVGMEVVLLPALGLVLASLPTFHQLWPPRAGGYPQRWLWMKVNVQQHSTNRVTAVWADCQQTGLQAAPPPQPRGDSYGVTVCNK